VRVSKSTVFQIRNAVDLSQAAQAVRSVIEHTTAALTRRSAG